MYMVSYMRKLPSFTVTNLETNESQSFKHMCALASHIGIKTHMIRTYLHTQCITPALRVFLEHNDIKVNELELVHYKPMPKMLKWALYENGTLVQKFNQLYDVCDYLNALNPDPKKIVRRHHCYAHMKNHSSHIPTKFTIERISKPAVLRHSNFQ